MRHAPEIELALPPRPADMPRQTWLYGQIRAAILDGTLAPGTRLPASRDLSQRLGLARGTVLTVFAQLAAEGYVVGRVGRGSFVAPELPDQRPASPDHPPTAEAQVGTAGLSARGRVLARTIFPLSAPDWPIPAFRASQPDIAAFPVGLWARIAARRGRLSQRALLTDGDALGYGPLRAAIADHLRAGRGIACTAGQVAILASVQQLLDLSARLLLDPGDQAWLEDPGYPGARLILEAAGARVVGVPVDAGGLDVGHGVAQAPAARLAYVTAGRQAPLGSSLALDRRLALLDWARTAKAVIIEDDYDSEFRFEGNPLAALKSLDRSGSVIYAGTFSKLMFPALRLAYAVLPDALVDPFQAAMSLTCRHAALGSQAVLHDFIAEGHLARHVRRMRLHYGERAQALAAAAQTHLAGMLDLPTIAAGLDAPAFLPAGIDDRKAVALAAAAGIETRPLSFYRVDGPVRPGLVLGFAAISPAAIETGARGLAEALSPLCRG